MHTQKPSKTAPPRQSILSRMVTQAALLTTFIILLLSTVSFLIIKSLLEQPVMNVAVSLHALAVSLSIVGVLCVLLAVALAYLLASKLTEPLRLLAERLSLLGPGHWHIKKIVKTDDEVGMLERVITDLSLRLQRLYRTQEQVIADRTEELKKQFALDRIILNGIDQGVVTVDAKGKVTAMNAAACRLLLCKAEECIGRAGTALLDILQHRGTELKTEHPLLTCIRKHQTVHSPVNTHWNILRTDGTMLPAMVTISPLMEGRKLFGAVVVLQDITEERRLDYIKAEFITLASHQLRTPLSAMRWYVELFQDEDKKLTPDQRQYLHEIEDGLVRMDALLTALLRASRLEGEGLKPEFRMMDATALIRDMESDSTLMAAEAGIRCTVSAPHTKVMMMSDPTLLRIVLQNLIGNAVKYSSRGQAIHIDMLANRTQVTVSVRDEGVGIPADEQTRIFQRFFRAKNVRQLDTDGCGLGLYITKSVVERLGGSIDFKSKEKKGTVFTVTLPLKQPVKKAAKKL